MAHSASARPPTSGSRHRAWRRVALPWLLSALLPLVGCSARGVAYRQDKRVHIVAPRSRQKVSLPVTVRWTVADFGITGPTGTSERHRGYFGVFVDRAPQPPGKPLTWFARNDAECEKKAGCPDSPYLAARDIFTATDTRFVVDQLARPPSSVHRKETHEVTVVLLDGNGRRVGETAFAVEFQVVREQG